MRTYILEPNGPALEAGNVGAGFGETVPAHRGPPAGDVVPLAPLRAELFFA